MDRLKIKDLEKQGYRLVGNHSAVKLCLWCKKAIKGEDSCYKEKFYDIKSHRCIQMTPSMGFCSHRCDFCWRNIEWTRRKFNCKIDEPEDIVDGCIKKHVEYIQGLGAVVDRNSLRFKETLEPKHFAISLSGEPCLYEKLCGLVSEIKSRKMTSFLVSNGTVPDMIEKLIDNQPDNMYISLNAFSEKNYLRVCKPLVKNGWEKLQKSLRFLREFKNGIIRMTLVKGLNFSNAEEYADILRNLDFKFLEVKSGMAVGYARYRVDYKDMVLHSEIRDFSEKLCELTGFKILDEKKESRVVLLKC